MRGYHISPVSPGGKPKVILLCLCFFFNVIFLIPKEAKGNNTSFLRSQSKYLREHAGQPVQWRPWSPKAFEEAKSKGIPVFLHIGYSSCHWCKVMSKESFNDPKIAKRLNKEYIPIIIDRMNNPEVSLLYLKFLEASAPVAGFPLNVWASHDRRPFYASGYLPPYSNENYPMGLYESLAFFSKAYKQKKTKVVNMAENFAKKIAAKASNKSFKTQTKAKSYAQKLIKKIKERRDEEYGGIKSASKYPLRFPYKDYGHITKWDKGRFDHFTLFKLASSPIHDQVSGGFHRYAQNRNWTSPHYEKMLTDNALLSWLMAKAWLESGNRAFKRASSRSSKLIFKLLWKESAGFHSALDADSKDEKGRIREGAWYQWPKTQIKHKACATKTSPNRYTPGFFTNTDFNNFDITSAKIPNACLEMYSSLKHDKNKVPPETDTMASIGASAMSINALFKTALALDDVELLKKVKIAYEILKSKLNEKQLSFGDMVFFLEASLTRLQFTSEDMQIQDLVDLEKRIHKSFYNKSTGGYNLDNGLLAGVNPFEIEGPDLPSSLITHHENLLKLYQGTYDKVYLKRAQKLGLFIEKNIPKAAIIDGYLSCLLSKERSGVQVVLVQGKEADLTSEIIRWQLKSYAPNVTLWLWKKNTNIPVLKGKEALNGRTTAYVCAEKKCSLPLTDLKSIRSAIQSI